MPTALQACIKNQPDTALKASMSEAELMGVQATPTMFINGQKLEGAVDADDVKLVLNEQLKAAGVQPPADTKPGDSASGEVVDLEPLQETDDQLRKSARRNGATPCTLARSADSVARRIGRSDCLRLTCDACSSVRRCV